jgi:hypothetical protein
MATRSTIAIELADGTVRQVYCHWDGYLDHNGKLLLNHYSDPLVAAELINVGDISSLRETVGEKHPFDARYDATDARYQWTTYYGRDRNEPDCGYKAYKDFDAYKNEHQYEEFEYVLRTDGFWYVSSYGGEYELLTEAIAEELRERALEEEDAE